MHKIILTFVAFVISVNVLNAQWTKTGPHNVRASCMVALTNGTLLVGTVSSGNNGYGVYKSTDGGGIWNPANTGLPNSGTGGVFSLVSKNDTIYITNANASTGNISVYRSVNAGGNWVAANTGLPTTVSVNNLYLGPNSIFISTGINALYRSTNGGQNWAIANTGLATNTTSGVISVNGNQLILANSNNQVYSSTNNGDNWSKLTERIDPNIVQVIFSFLWNGTTVLAGTSGGLYRSTDNGATWKQAANAGLFGSIAQGMTITLHNGNLYAGTPNQFGGNFFKSTDSGENWSDIISNLPSYHRRTLFGFAAIGTTFYAGIGDYGVYRTSDAGVTWEVRNQGFPVIPTVFAMINVGTKIFIGTTQNLFSSSDGGQTWYQSSTGIDSSSNFSAVTALGVKSDTIFVGTSLGKVFRSDNGGKRFVEVSTGLSGSKVKGFVFAGNVIVIANGGVYRSTNNGTSWSLITAGITSGAIGENISMIGNDIYLGTQISGLFKSTDIGLTWNRVGATVFQNNYTPSGITNIGSDIYCNLVVPFIGGGIYKSSDNGATWPAVTVTLPGSNAAPYSILNVNNTLFAGVYSLFSSTVMQGVGGTTWTDIGQGLTFAGAIRVLSFLNRGSELFASFATSTDAPMDIWKRTIVTEVTENNSSIPNEFYLFQNYPNPFNPSTKITYQLPADNHVSLKVYDALGREVAILVNDARTAGKYEIPFDASKLSTGIYFYKLQAGNYIETKKMILTK